MLKLKLQYFGHLMRRTDSLEKTLTLGKIAGWRRRLGTTEDEMVGWYHCVVSAPKVLRVQGRSRVIR